MVTSDVADGAPPAFPQSGALPSASSLLSSRWSRDNLVTSDPTRLYDGVVSEQVDIERIRYWIGELEPMFGAVQVKSAVMGVFTCDVHCASQSGAFSLQVPRVLDEPGTHGRAKRLVPRHNVENIQYYLAQGRGRFVVEPKHLVVLEGNVPAALFPVLTGYHPLTFGQGAIRADLYQGELSWTVAFGAETTAELLAEIVAALVYHYEPERDGGTALTDVFVNDGDFWVRRRCDGSFELKLRALRRREPGIGPNRLLLYLIQLMTYEDWSVDEHLIGLPVLLSNPAIAFAGLVRGLSYLYRDQERDEAEGVLLARRWIEQFGRSPEGRAYRPFVERFLAGRLPLNFGTDLRERWWRTVHLEQRLSVIELRVQHGQPSIEAGSARAFRALLERLQSEIGRLPETTPLAGRINDLGREGLLQLLEEARVAPEIRASVVDALLTHWPYWSLDTLLARVPSASGLRRVKARLSFGHVIRGVDEGTLKSLAPAPKQAAAPRLIANPEFFSALTLAPAQHESAVQTFPTFEGYMDSALHDERSGYYAHRVVIGKGGHFTTNPECFSPHYGKWIAERAFRLWQDMLEHGELSVTDAFVVVEFGAGNGRLAHDFLNGIGALAARAPAAEAERWRLFTACVKYRIYETSPSLRAKQAELLGERVVVAIGDARRPAATLQRDFPSGLKGLVVTNEVPDAFGVHKLLLTAEGHAFVALCVPRVEVAACAALPASLVLELERANAHVRATYGFTQYPDDYYLDGTRYASLMAGIADLAEAERTQLLAALWFEEVYVSASYVPDVAVHLKHNAEQYAIALAVEASGVVVYINTHADRFMRELGASLAAGFVLTIDYGDATWGLVQGARRGDFPFRIYRDGEEYLPLPNDPYAFPGTQDMTADVNFTDLARAGEAAGMQLVHFGPERDITGEAFPEVLAATDQPAFAEFVGCPVFKLLVLGTRATQCLQTRFTSSLPLRARANDVPKAQRQRIAFIQQVLEGAGR